MVCYKNRKKKKYGLMCVYGGKGEVMTVGMPYAGYHRDIDDIFCGDKNDFKKVLSPF